MTTKNKKTKSAPGVPELASPVCSLNRKVCLAVDAAIHTIVRLKDPCISNAEIQKRCGTDIGSGYYTVTLDGDPVAMVQHDGDSRVTITVF